MTRMIVMLTITSRIADPIANSRAEKLVLDTE